MACTHNDSGVKTVPAYTHFFQVEKYDFAPMEIFLGKILEKHGALRHTSL